jgi:hypothetical protein
VPLTFELGWQRQEDKAQAAPMGDVAEAQVAAR